MPARRVAPAIEMVRGVNGRRAVEHGFGRAVAAGLGDDVGVGVGVDVTVDVEVEIGPGGTMACA